MATKTHIGLTGYDHFNRRDGGTWYVPITADGIEVRVSVEAVARGLLAGNRTLLRTLSRIVNDPTLRPAHMDNEDIRDALRLAWVAADERRMEAAGAFRSEKSRQLVINMQSRPDPDDARCARQNPVTGEWEAYDRDGNRID